MSLVLILNILFQYFLLPAQVLPFESYSQKIGTDSIKLVPVAGGTFQMGSEADSANPDQLPVHEVKVDSFWMASLEISWAIYEQFSNRDSDSEQFPNLNDDLGIKVDGISGATTPYIDMSFGMGKDGFPATSMTQYAALSFCKWLSAKTGHFYRLRTEAEWEYACRKGQDENLTLEEQSWYELNSEEGYKKTGKKKPNALGIHDMLGNVAEWTMDQYITDYYSKSPQNNPWAIPDQLYPRSLRGGSWHDDADKCDCSSRQFSSPRWKRIDPQFPKSRWWHTNAPFVGIRVVRPYMKPAADEIKKFWLEPIDDYE